MKGNNTEIKNQKSANTFLMENVVSRLGSIRAYQDARSNALAFNKGERRTIAVSAAASLAITTGILHKKGDGIQVGSFIDTWFIVAAGVLAVLFVIALFSRKKLVERIAPVKNISIEAEDVLKSYFVDFVKEQVVLDDDKEAVLGRISQFKTITKADDKRLGERDIVLSGFCHYRKNVVEQSITLAFANDYTNLSVKHYDRVVAVKNNDVSVPSVSA